VREVHARFTEVCAERARRIARLFDSAYGEHQPGLFDRRVERHHHDAADAQLAARAHAEERLARAEASGTLDEPASELVLLLTPGADGARR